MSDDPEVGLSGTINKFVSKTFPSPPDEPVTSAADKMKMLGITESVVVRAGLRIGILTERTSSTTSWRQAWTRPRRRSWT